MPCGVRLRKQTLLRQGHRCFNCGLPQEFFNDPFHIHRVVPARLGGKYVSGNVVACCAECHRKVEGLTPEEIELLQPYGMSISHGIAK